MVSRKNIVLALLAIIFLLTLAFAANVNEAVLGDAMPDDALIIGAVIADWAGDGKDLNTASARSITTR